MTKVTLARNKENNESTKPWQDLARELDNMARTIKSADKLMHLVVKTLNEQKLYYNWVGFYLISKADPQWLELGPFAGAMTPHTRIAINQGLCGAAASSGKTIVVDDVSKDSRYLACSVETKSEIVAPVFVRGKVVGELDIDSFIPAAFQQDDRELVEACASIVGHFMERHPQ